MSDINIRETLISNMIKLRKDRGLTQSELGEKISYSDKTVSKWENGDSCPNIEAIYRIAQFYNVTVDDLLSDGFELPELSAENTTQHTADLNRNKYSKIIIAMLCVLSVWTIALIAFMFTSLRGNANPWLSFIDALPYSFVVLFVLNKKWGCVKNNYIIVSLLLWTGLTAVFLHMVMHSYYNMWMLYLFGIPMQIAIILWSQLKK